MHCTLLIPDLLPPPDLGAEPYADLHVPDLCTLLARGETVQRPPLPVEDWLCERFNVPAEPDRPLGALMLHADGGNPLNDYWLCAEPIQLRVDRNRLIVAARVADYTGVEAHELTAALNAHFSADGIEFSAPTPPRWYARACTAPRLTTTPLTQALNRSSQHHLPRGADAMAWHRVMNEAQMILHTHPVNTARETQGRVAANSIWLWGGGALPAVARPSYTLAAGTSTFGGGAVLRALAIAAGIVHRELPQRADDLLTAGAEHLLIMLDEPAEELRNGDFAAWHDRLEVIDRTWIGTLLEALRMKTLERLTLIANCRDNLLETTVTRANLARFWRRSRPLAYYANAA